MISDLGGGINFYLGRLTEDGTSILSMLAAMR
jgi:hypothetical protein